MYIVVNWVGGARINGRYLTVATERSLSDMHELKPAQAEIFCLSDGLARHTFHTASFFVAVTWQEDSLQALSKEALGIALGSGRCTGFGYLHAHQEQNMLYLQPPPQPLYY